LVSTGSGSHGPTYVSRLERADWTTFRANRVVVVARNAAASRTALRSVACHRNQASCTMSSASAALPSMRYAMPNSRGRARTKAERAWSSALVSTRPSPRTGTMGTGQCLRVFVHPAGVGGGGTERAACHAGKAGRGRLHAPDGAVAGEACDG